ncbi:exodeoxyribonuclease VII large subunit [uncultured Corynebacterium sp.]|uniref:exodeoxyribonuclease VII large subunit n=1 Tax=uncultured Corynebacterium sp. TaxID=159447 RepID=UPI0025DED584|nr:exodeoxyribonuclease VII large subunit [uncultured Corynebacterium sp.]
MSKKLTTSAEAPVQVRKLNQMVKSWIEQLGQIWVEGEVAQVNAKPSWSLAYLTLRDTQSDASVSVTCSTKALQAHPLSPGDRVVMLGKPAFYAGRGSFSLWATEWRPVGVGELLARIERLRMALAAEGLFDARLKRRLPFLPRRIGLITGRGSAAERDVLSVAQGRWPEVDFEVINTPVQGAKTVPAILPALESLDADPSIDVIIIARGGGSVEDLLPFSDEALVRAVSRATTPVVSAIGHEPDNPLLDHVADLRAATPTDAAKRVVPDVAEERRRLEDLRARSAAALRRWVDREGRIISDLRSRPVIADPMNPIRSRAEDIARGRDRLRGAISRRLEREEGMVEGLRGKVSALGPAATLARGYSVVQVQPRDGSDDQVVTTIEQSPPGSQLRIRVADGSITAAAMGVKPAD